MSMPAVESARPRRPPPLEVRVERVERRPGGFVRVVLSGPALRAFSWPGAASHLKFFPPAVPGGLAVVAPERPLSRTYTPRAFDPERLELELDFLVHGEGPASSWAETAEPGDAVRVSVPRARYEVPEGAHWLLLAGDDSAVPAIATILDLEAAVATEVLVETVSSEADRPGLPVHDKTTVTWLAAREAAPGAALGEAVARWRPPPEPGAVWVACEALAVRRIRTHLLGDLGLARELVVTRGYWREGAANHPDHDFGEEFPER